MGGFSIRALQAPVSKGLLDQRCHVRVAALDSQRETFAKRKRTGPVRLHLGEGEHDVIPQHWFGLGVSGVGRLATNKIALCFDTQALQLGAKPT